MKIAGIVLIIIGIIALIYQGFSYTAPHKDAQIGSLVIQHDETHSVWVSPVIGGACIVGGVVLFAVSGRKSM
jgi:drug/metabolite transporter (DMT)-like permease